ncbi:MAG: hypothetical protein J0I49_14635 [Pseudonocardia sp.]|uniref:hypothetical protein n=1 Tax=Pseudonocardia sp. TaxID=60912 RepID=UPI001AC38898|nr:hypothetical protein [Pseudonocardia sp.]MBN9099332.1 hypothetical protein [Pseudonocardia sp.]
MTDGATRPDTSAEALADAGEVRLEVPHAAAGQGPGAASDAAGARPSVAEAQRWTDDYQDFVHTRMIRVQAAAQQWLVTMTALLGVFSAVTVLGGPTTIDTAPAGAAQWIVLGMAGLVYLLAFAAVYYGALATFGGLGLRPATPQERDYARDAAALQTCPDSSNTDQLAADVTRLARLRRATPRQEWWRARPISGGVRAYIDSYEFKTNTLRANLHRSRVLGISAAILSGVLAWTLLLLRVLHPSL